jgi:hypothetical protein
LKAEDRIGKEYNWLTVIGFYRIGKNPHVAKVVFRCRCRCGRLCDQHSANILRVKSCGCYQQSRINNKVIGRPEYAIWVQMNQRCYNKRCKAYKNYGARGVMVCEAWRAKPGKQAAAFRAFLKHVGPRPKGARRQWSIERKDNNGNYEPGNVRWASNGDQSRNKRGNRWLTFQGKTLVITDWAKKLKISAPTIKRRLRQGWSLRRTLTTPATMRGRKVWARDRGLPSGGCA